MRKKKPSEKEIEADVLLEKILAIKIEPFPSLDDMVKSALKNEKETDNPNARYLIPQAAKYLKVSESTVRRRITDGSIYASKVAGKYQIKKSDMDMYLSTLRKIHTSPKLRFGKKPKVDTDKIIRNIGLKKYPKRGDR